jgi:hypothetical protein
MINVANQRKSPIPDDGLQIHTGINATNGVLVNSSIIGSLVSKIEGII